MRKIITNEQWVNFINILKRGSTPIYSAYLCMEFIVRNKSYSLEKTEKFLYNILLKQNVTFYANFHAP